MTQATNRMPAGNTGFASGGVTCKLGALCFYSSSVLVDCFVLRNPPERKARKRYKPYYEHSTEQNILADFISRYLPVFMRTKSFPQRGFGLLRTNSITNERR